MEGNNNNDILFALLLDNTVIFNRYVIVTMFYLITTLSHNLSWSCCRTPKS